MSELKLVNDTMAPAKSIRLECRWCSNCKPVDCISKVCRLKDVSLSPLKRIRAHCLDCVETRQEVKECTGKLLFEDRLCYLHSYRFGTNPKRAGIGRKGGNPNIRNIKKTQSHDMVLASRNVSETLVW